MWIITVNLPIPYLKSIDGLVGEKGLYTSRSELIRVAIREFLIRELDAAQSYSKAQTNPPVIEHPIQMIDEDLFVRVPVSSSGELDGQEFKTYRIVKK